jgi:hypothetical protein
MGRIHDQLLLFGRQESLALATSAQDRALLDAAYAYMSDDEGTVGFLFAGWCQSALPHRRLPDDEVWLVKTDRIRLMVEPGSIEKGGEVSRVGVPYGSRARLILLYLQSEAIRTQNRDIELGRSLRVWLGKLGVPIGGKSVADVRDQCLRLSRCRMTFQIQQGSRTGFAAQNIVDTAMFSDENGSSLLETVRLSESFFAELQRHPVPLQESAIKPLSNNSQALDVYCWLAYRLHALAGPTEVSWAALRAQFGASYSVQRVFRRRFKEALDLAMSVYPDAKVEVCTGGLKLLPSAPPVPARLPKVSKIR